MAKIEKGVAFANVGSLIQLAGVGCAVVGVFFGGLGAFVGLLLMVLLLVVGSSRSKTYRCGECRNPVADARVRMCPTCKVQLE